MPIESKLSLPELCWMSYRDVDVSSERDDEAVRI